MKKNEKEEPKDQEIENETRVRKSRTTKSEGGFLGVTQKGEITNYLESDKKGQNENGLYRNVSRYPAISLTAASAQKHDDDERRR